MHYVEWNEFKILRIKKREYRDGIYKKEGDKIGMECTHNAGEACGAYITKGCIAT